MQVNSYNSMAQLSFSNVCNTKSSEQNISNTFKQKFDIVEISSKTVTASEEINKSEYNDEEITEFLKDKPYSAFYYEYYQKYASDKGKSYITDVMDRYYNKKIQSPIYSIEMRINSEALEKGLNTLEKFKEQLVKEAAAQKALDIDAKLSFLSEVQKYNEDYGIRVYHFGHGYDRRDMLPITLILDSSLMYQDMQVDKNGQVMILPKESDKWVTKAEFIEMYPDYKLYESLDSRAEVGQALSKGEDAIKKYAEDFIAGLSEEEIQMIKDNDLFSSPSLQVTGIKCIEQFTKEIEDIKIAEVQKWTGLNQRRDELIKLAEKSKQNFAKEKAAGVGNVSLYEVIPYYPSNSERDAKLIAELGLSDYIKIDASKIDLEKGLINGYRLDMDFINEYSECFYFPERDNGLYRYLDFKDGELEQALMKYGSSKNIEKAYLYAINNNLSLDILSNDYSSLIEKDNSLSISITIGGNSYAKSNNLNGRDDFLTALFSEKNNEKIDENVGLVLDLKSKYLSKINKYDNIDMLLDIL